MEYIIKILKNEGLINGISLIVSVVVPILVMVFASKYRCSPWRHDGTHRIQSSHTEPPYQESGWRIQEFEKQWVYQFVRIKCRQQSFLCKR